jgi:hypothetical protein
MPGGRGVVLLAACFLLIAWLAFSSNLKTGTILWSVDPLLGNGSINTLPWTWILVNSPLLGKPATIRDNSWHPLLDNGRVFRWGPTRGYITVSDSGSSSSGGVQLIVRIFPVECPVGRRWNASNSELSRTESEFREKETVVDQIRIEWVLGSPGRRVRLQIYCELL